MVVDQIPHGHSPIMQLPGHLAGLLGDPRRIRMSRATGQVDSSGRVFDEKQDIQRLESEGFDRQKIARQKLFLVVIENSSLDKLK
jgi:hypothetical protein